MKLHLIRSATIRLTMARTTLLVDPWLAAKGEGRSYAGRLRSPLVGLPCPPAEIVAGIDAVVVSHLHSDHFDDAARNALDRRIPLFAPSGLHAALREQGFLDVRGGQQRGQPQSAVGPIDLEWTAGRHGPPEILDEMGPVAGFLLRADDEPVVYWVGDSIMCPEVRCVIETQAPEIIVVHACGASWNGVGPLVMDEDMVVETLRMSGNATVIATHLDAVDHATVSRVELASRAATLPSDMRSRLFIPADGDALTFPG